MAVAKSVTAQRDFAAGELDIDAKRNDESKALKAGARQMSNWRILNSAIANRPGRRALFLDGPRIEKIQMAPGFTFFIVFGNTRLSILSMAPTTVLFNQGSLPWTTATAKNVVYWIFKNSIYVCFPGMQPLVVNWDGAASFAAVNYTPATTTAGRKLTPFYRFAAPGIAMALSALTGAGVTVTFSAPVLTASHVGTVMRYYDRQILITAAATPISGTCTVSELLRPIQSLRFSAPITGAFAVGDILVGAINGLKVYVAQVGTPTANDITAILLGSAPFTGGEIVVGPSGTAVFSSLLGALTTGPAIAVWDEEVFNAFRGWPSSVFADQNRLGFCNFPSVPGGIAWSQFDNATDFDIGANPTDAMFEIAPNKGQVFFVVPGPESSEFVFCDNAVWYIPISGANPLKPGSVNFQLVSSDGCLNLQPRAVEEAIIFMTSAISAKTIIAIGAYYRPYKTYDISDLRNHVFNNPVAIAVPTQEGSFPERYLYVLNGDGTVAVAKYQIEQGTLKPESIGWVRWSGAGTLTWISAFKASVFFTGTYAPNGVSPVSLFEELDNTLYLDGGLPVNSIPAALAPAPGLGPLWWLANGTVVLMDLGTRMMGTYSIDAAGFIVPQGLGGEDLTSAQLVAGQQWTATFEPFVPAVQPGQDVQQRMRKRRIARVEVYVQNSTGFVFARLFSGPNTPTSPALGTIMNERRITAWNQDDNPLNPPPQRERAYSFRPIGRAHDPRVAFIKDTPGPITILEQSMEVTV